MKIFKSIAKTSGGIVKFPPAMEKDAKKRVRNALFSYLYNTLKTPQLRSLVVSEAKKNGFPVKKIPASEHEFNFGKGRIIPIKWDFSGLPESYFKLHPEMKNKKDVLNIYFDYSSKEPDYRNFDFKCNSGYEGYYTENGTHTNSGILVAPSSIVLMPTKVFKEIYQIENTLSAYLKSLEDDKKWFLNKKKQGSKDADKLLADQDAHAKARINIAKVRMQAAFEKLDETIQHELRHFVQHKLLHEYQNKQFKGYENKDNRQYYYTSPSEFGPIINTALENFKIIYKTWLREAKLWDIKYKDDPSTMKKLDLIDNDTIEYDFAIFGGTEPKTNYEKNKIYYTGFNTDGMSEAFKVLKRSKPTAYAKALKYLKVAENEIKEYLKKLKSQKTARI